jgi:hypothetical protein
MRPGHALHSLRGQQSIKTASRPAVPIDHDDSTVAVARLANAREHGGRDPVGLVVEQSRDPEHIGLPAVLLLKC